MRGVLRWVMVPLVTAALGGAALPASAASTMTTYEIDLISLQCNKKHDLIGPDDAQLIIDGIVRFGPRHMGRGDSVVLTGTHDFTGTAVMELFDVDNGQDDYLGSVVVDDSESGQGVQVGTFDHLGGARYTILYEVNPA